MIRSENPDTFEALSGCCGYGKDLRGRKGFVTMQGDSPADSTPAEAVFWGERARCMA
jgi:hypothetical protein